MDMEKTFMVLGLIIVSCGAEWTEVNPNVSDEVLISEGTGSSENKVAPLYDAMLSNTNISSSNTAFIPSTGAPLSSHMISPSFHSSGASTSVSHSLFSSSSHSMPLSSSHSVHSPSSSHSMHPSSSHSMHSSFSSHSMHSSSSRSMHSVSSQFVHSSSSQAVHSSSSHSVFSSYSPFPSHSAITSMSESPRWSSGFPLHSSELSSSSGATSEITATTTSSRASSNGTSVTATPSLSTSQHGMQTSSSPHLTSSSNIMTSHISVATSSQSPASSSAAPTTKPTAKPIVKPVVLKLVDSQTKKTCIELMAVVDFEVNYQAGKEKKEVQVKLTSGQVSGNCAKPNHTAASIAVTFAKFYTFMMEFTVEKNSMWKTSNVTFSAILKSNPAFPNATADLISGHLSTQSSADAAEFKASNRSFKCDKERDIHLTSGITVEFKTLQLQPFTLNNNTFSEPDLCMDENNKNKGNSIVPIAVGCALAGLIIIVLIAYLIGRRRSHRGYQQV